MPQKSKSVNCHSRCRSAWHTNEELRKKHEQQKNKDMKGRTRAYYDVILTKKQYLELMKKTMKEIEEENEFNNQKQ